MFVPSALPTAHSKQIHASSPFARNRLNPNCEVEVECGAAARGAHAAGGNFRRLAENLVPQTFSRPNRTKKVRRRFGRAAQTGTRAACATHSCFGVQAKFAGEQNFMTRCYEQLAAALAENQPFVLALISGRKFQSTVHQRQGFFPRRQNPLARSAAAASARWWSSTHAMGLLAVAPIGLEPVV